MTENKEWNSVCHMLSSDGGKFLGTFYVDCGNKYLICRI
jgi:hypothetical protein